jgi:anaerobic selenocysteine-containing dehydrogenase/Fe-S-cluster-containing dehydrogenase component
VIDRRRFLKTIGLTGSAALVDHCAPAPSEKLIPYLVAPDNITPGVPAYYATTCRACPAGCGMLAKVMDGRVIKAEGNPDHPISRGHLCARGQASVQSLYNPDRFGMPRRRNAKGGMDQIGWDEAETLLAARLRESKARGPNRIAWIGGVATGSFDELITMWLQSLGSSRRLLYEPFDYEPLRAAGELAFGRREVPQHDFGRARYVLSFGAEFLETWISNVEFTGGFSDVRRARLAEGADSFAWISPRLSLTGLNADVWIASRPGSETLVALAIAQSLTAAGLTHPSAAPHLPWVQRVLQPYAAELVQAATDVDPAAVHSVARQFASVAPSLAVGGGVSGTGEHNAVTLEAAVLLLNVLAGNIGTTVHYGAGCALDRLSTRAEIAVLIEAMGDGQIDVLLVHDSNPVFTLPAAAGFANALRRVPLVVTFSNVPDETSALAHLVLPDHHFLESWGDYAPRTAVENLLQPAAAPLLHSRATADVLLDVARQVDGDTARALGDEQWLDFLRRRWSAATASTGDETSDEGRWLTAVRAGGRVHDVAPAPVTLRDLSSVFNPDRLPPTGSPVGAEAGGVTLIAHPFAHFYDGRSANEPWLREVPDSATGIVWNGWLEIHRDTARKLRINDGDIVEVESPHGRVQATAHLSAELRPDVIAMPIGFGRRNPLRFAGGRGADVGALLPAHAADGTHASWRADNVRLRKAAGQRLIIKLTAAASTFAADQSRAHSDANRGASTLYPSHAHPEHRWGMAIDLNTCTGCSACVVACYAENNVPVVGDEGCAQGREMSWIRIERGGGAFMPMLCQQCDDAPCEAVCPVTATYHNPEGLNAQIYNRCIGTRFCSNNCPYKVRRFNFERPSWDTPLERQLNPDVTVRSAGVMEKCTFCIQRIQFGKNQAKRDHRPVRDGEITPACAQTCPTDAIVFGDLHDPNSRVSRLSADPRAFRVLDELGTRPAIAYLRRQGKGIGNAAG